MNFALLGFLCVENWLFCALKFVPQLVILLMLFIGKGSGLGFVEIEQKKWLGLLWIEEHVSGNFVAGNWDRNCRRVTGCFDQDQGRNAFAIGLEWTGIGGA
jgi:hypothetical protein